MNKFMTYASAAVLVAVLTACGATAKMLAAKTQSEKSDVFTEVSGTEPVPDGYADVLITAEIKTHLEGHYKGESASSGHGKEAYPYLFNIDGQAAIWKADGKKHELPRYEPDGKTSRDPEAGAGMKYVLNKKIRMRAGAHMFFFGLPADNYYQEFSVTLKDGQVHTLGLKPRYGHKHVPTRMPTFRKGILHYDILINGTLMAETAM